MLEVVDPGFLTTVQDLGRWQALRYGVPISGAMDRFALMAANQLVGNDWNAAGLECFGEGPLLIADQDLLVAGAGAGYSLVAGTCSYPLWTATFVPRGELFGLRGLNPGRWGYLAVSGGIDVPMVLGSRSTYLRIALGGLEGRTLLFGDHLPTGSEPNLQALSIHSGRNLAKELIPQYPDELTVEFIPYSQSAPLPDESLESISNAIYTITEQSDRMGYRLSGPAIETGGGNVLSEGVVPGTIQLPPGGQPVVLLSDAQTTGGYTKLGAIASADLGRFVQCPIGSGQVRLSVTTVTLALQRWQKMMRGLRSCCQEADPT